MTISKKAFVGILSLTVAVSLAACSNNANQTGNTGSSQNKRNKGFSSSTETVLVSFSLRFAHSFSEQIEKRFTA